MEAKIPSKLNLNDKNMKKIITIGNKKIGHSHPVFIIAEAGVNHNGRLDLALKLVDAARNVGANAVKFQTGKAEEVTAKHVPMAAYQKKNIGKSEDQFRMIKKIELKEEFYKPIIKHCVEKGILFLSTPHGGFESVKFLQKLKVAAFKFGSGDLTNLPILEYAARFKKPMIISTGMATMKEIEEAVKCIRKSGNNKIILLQCTTDYPTKDNEVNLRAMTALRDKIKVIVGYSDHNPGIVAAIAATAMGATLIEKHLTLDKKMKGPDHKASNDQKEFKEMVCAIRRAEVLLGSSKKNPQQSELQYINLIRKSIVANSGIKKGEKFTRKNIAIKRPGTGLLPKYIYNIIGREANNNIANDSLIKKGDLE